MASDHFQAWGHNFYDDWWQYYTIDKDWNSQQHHNYLQNKVQEICVLWLMDVLINVEQKMGQKEDEETDVRTYCSVSKKLHLKATYLQH